MRDILVKGLLLYLIFTNRRPRRLAGHPERLTTEAPGGSNGSPDHEHVAPMSG